MVFENGVKNIQAVAYNGACTVYENTSGPQKVAKTRGGSILQNMTKIWV